MCKNLFNVYFYVLQSTAKTGCQDTCIASRAIIKTYVKQ